MPRSNGFALSRIREKKKKERKNETFSILLEIRRGPRIFG